MCKPTQKFPWRSRSDLRKHFHPECPDDIQALFFFSLTRTKEKMWVRIIDLAPEYKDRFVAELLNDPSSTDSLKKGDLIIVRKVPQMKEPVYLSSLLQEDLQRWIFACQNCKLDMHFQSISSLTSQQFPNAPYGSTPISFTTRCPLCKQTMLLTSREGQKLMEQTIPEESPLIPDSESNFFQGEFLIEPRRWPQSPIRLDGSGHFELTSQYLLVNGILVEHYSSSFRWSLFFFSLGLLGLLFQQATILFIASLLLIFISFLFLHTFWKAQVKDTKQEKEEVLYKIPWSSVSEVMHDLERPQELAFLIENFQPSGILLFRYSGNMKFLLKRLSNTRKQAKNSI